jgi:hypothetical protein
MKAKLKSYYRKSSTVMVFVYIVLGTLEELAKYAIAQGDRFRTENPDGTGAPLFFSMRPLSHNRNESVPLLITANGRVVADDLDKVLKMDEIGEMELAKQKAKLLAKQFVSGDVISRLSNATATRPVEQLNANDEPEDLFAEPIVPVNTEPVVVGEPITV